jgi:hypothetical protein
MHEFSENIQGFGRNHGHLAGLCHQGVSLFSIACPVTEEPKNQALLSQPRHLGDVEIIQLKVGEIVSPDIPRILFNISKIKDKKQVMRLEVPKLYTLSFA